MKELSLDNNTKIKYISAQNKLYQVTDINFSDLTLEASETNLLASDVPPEQLFDVMEFREFRVRLRNGTGKVIDIEEYLKRRGIKF